MVPTESSLGKWALIDIETSGINPHKDSIIDIGFLQFDGLKLEKKFSSLIQFPMNPEDWEEEPKLSQFVQKLTGITESQLDKAPHWNIVKDDLLDLYGMNLIAHNAAFEESFLSPHFERISDGSRREQYWDSIYYLSLLFPDRSQLNLESFICDWGVRDKELHRGFEDSLDLLKVMLTGTLLIRKDKRTFAHLQAMFLQYSLGKFWFRNFFQLSEEELYTLASEVDFDLDASLDKALAQSVEQTQGPDGESSFNHDLFSAEFSGKNIQSILSDEEKVQEILPNYKFRQGQMELSLKVGQSFKNGVHSIVQAPTGTGKTLGYLLPSALYSKEKKEKVLIATGTKTLQSQAINKDIPQLKRLLGNKINDSLKMSLLVGSNNHLCELLFRRGDESGELPLEDISTFDREFTSFYFENLFFQNQTRTHNDKLIRGNIPYFLKQKIPYLAQKEKEFAVDFRSCSGARCPYKGDCSYISGLQEAKEADIIVGNHSLMFNWPKSIDRPSHIVIDEAHRIEGETTSSFSLTVTSQDVSLFKDALIHYQGLGSLFYLLAQKELEPGASSEVIKNLQEKARHVAQLLDDHLPPLMEKTELFFKKLPRYTSDFWNERPFYSKEEIKESLALAIFHHLDSMSFILGDLVETLLPYESKWDINQEKDENIITALTRFETFFGQAQDLSDNMKTFLSHQEGHAHSMQYHELHGWKLSSAPINVGEVFYQNLLETTESVVMTSATLANENGDSGTQGLEWSLGYVYVDPKKRFQRGFFLPSPFDYKTNSKVYLVPEVRPLWDAQFVPETLEQIFPLIDELGGRTLLLFSARSRFEIAREVLISEFEGKIPLFIQGMGNDVIEDFKKEMDRNGRGILLGMESFGEGIDIPGKALEFLFIDKIPDLRQDFVIEKRRDFFERNIGNEFTDYYLAHRTRSLHQKLGRLIRRETDRGGAIIVDSRVKKWKGPTIKKFQRLMHPYDIERTTMDNAIHGIKDFLQKEP